MQQLTMLLLLVVWLQIYCNSVVLSLPPSLIANAASGIRHQHQVRQQQQRAKEQEQSGISSSPSSSFNTNALWKKDNNANYYDSMAVQGERALEAVGMDNDGIKGSSRIYNNNNNNLLTKSRIIPPNALASNRGMQSMKMDNLTISVFS